MEERWDRKGDEEGWGKRGGGGGGEEEVEEERRVVYRLRMPKCKNESEGYMVDK